MKETAFTAMLARINYPPHNPTFQAATKGHPLSKGRWLSHPMEPEDALRLSRMAMFHMILRIWKEYKNTDEWGAKGLKRYTAKKREEKKWKSETLALMKFLEELGNHYTVTISVPHLGNFEFKFDKI